MLKWDFYFFKNPNKFNFEVEGNSLRFPQSKNTLTLVQMENDLKVILNSAKIKYNIDNYMMIKIIFFLYLCQ